VGEVSGGQTISSFRPKFPHSRPALPRDGLFKFEVALDLLQSISRESHTPISLITWRRVDCGSYTTGED
jgi:hypothetical protein